MKSLIKKIEKLINKIDIKEDKSKLIMNTVILNICNSIGLNELEILNIGKSEIKSVKNSSFFKELKRVTINEDWSNDLIIPTVYELTKREKVKQKIYGLYYSPFWVLKYIVDRTFKNNINLVNLEEVKILEPSCGCGNFLIYIFDTLYNWYKLNTDYDDYFILKRIFENNLYANDIDVDALYYCKIVLTFKCFKILGYNAKFKFNIFKKDYLLDDYFNNIKFDIILGNPPFLENRKINKYLNKELFKSIYNTAKGRFDISTLFIEKSIKLLKEQGVLGFILPSTLLYNNNFSIIRKLILDNTSIYEIVDLGSDIFNNVDIDMIAIIIKNKSNKENNIICKSINNRKDKTNAIKNVNFRIIPQKYYDNNIKYVYDIFSTDTTFNLRQRIYHQNYTKINDVCEIIAGIATGNIRNKLLSCNKENIFSKKILEGKNINEYNSSWSGLYIKYDKSLINKEKGEYATFMRQEFIDNEKILIRQTADRFICTYDDDRYYILNTLYSLILRNRYKDKFNIKYILGLLNSKLYSFLYRSLIREKGKLFPQVKIFHIQLSPLKEISIEKQNEFVKIVDNILHCNNLLKNNKNINIINEINFLKRELDYKVYGIFNLSNKEIDIVENEFKNNTEEKLVSY